MLRSLKPSTGALIALLVLLVPRLHAGPQGQRDCNRNGVADAADIAGGRSLDRNSNGVPDECERAPLPATGGSTGGTTSNVVGVGGAQGLAPLVDATPFTVAWDCNGNGISDALDLSGGTSADCNTNGRPDECEIAAGSSQDTNSNGIPDECEVPVEPVAGEDSYPVTMDTPLVVSPLEGVLANDSDPNMDPLVAVLFADVSSGALALASDGSFSYTPNAGFVGIDEFRYQASDGTNLSPDVRVTLVVSPAPSSGLLLPPPPGSVYKEFTRVMSAGSDWRVTDPNATNPGTPGNSPGTYLPNNVLPLDIDDLTGALRAEAVIDLWGGHVGTTNKELSLNGNAPIIIPELATTPTAGECYVQQPNVVVEVPLGQLTLGTNFIQGNSGGQTCHNDDWGQWGWYAITLRVYYDESHPHPTGTVTAPLPAASFDEDPVVTADAVSAAGISRVEFFAYYDGYDTDGDGLSTAYQYNRHRAPTDTHMDARDHVGTDFVAPFEVTWDTELVPDQDPSSIRILARIRDMDGTWYVTPEVTGLSLARSLHTVELLKPTNVPELFWSHEGDVKSSDFIVTPGGLDNVVSTRLLVKTWNGIDGQIEPGDTSFRSVNSWITPVFGGNHFYSYDIIDVPPAELFEGTNTFSVQATTIHHGIEVMWPGPAMLVRRDLPPSTPAPPTGLAAMALGGGSVQLDWDDHPAASVDRYRVYQGLTPGFTLDGTTLIASDVSTSELLVTGLPLQTTVYLAVTAVHVAGPESGPSNEASVTTMTDTTPPGLLSVSAQIATEVLVLFNEPVELASAENVANYTLSSTGGNPAIMSAGLGADQRTVTLVTTALTQNETYSFTATGVLDLAVPSNASSAMAQFTFTGGLLAHYPFDEGTGSTTADALGGPSGILAAPVWSTSTGDASPHSLFFDGSDDAIDLGAPVASGDALALALWFNADDFGVSDARLISKAVGVQENEHHWMISTVFTEGETRLRFRVKAGGETSTLIASSGAVTAGLWTHVTATYDGVTMRLYKDGVLVGSRIKSGDLDPGVGVELAVGNQPSGAGVKPFDGFIDDVRIFERGLGFGEIQVLAGTGVPAMTGAPPVIDFWYGPTQRFGQLGIPQEFVNVLGKVTDADNNIAFMSYTLNGGPSVGLNIGPDTRRLQNLGDFNVDIPYASLLALPAMNTLTISAEDGVGNIVASIVNLEYTAGVTWPGSYVVDWDSAPELEDVSQVVDGLWAVQGGKAVTVEAGYDRLISLGNVTHANYEVTVPITVHSIDAIGFPLPSAGPLIGIGLRWPGHSDAALDPGFFGPGPAQPEWGFFPAGALCWYHWSDPGDYSVGEFAVNENYFAGAEELVTPFVFDDEYMFKARISSLPDLRPRTEFKFWRPSIETEPGVWYLQRDGLPGDPTSGGLLLIAHHVDVEIGDVVVTELP